MTSLRLDPRLGRAVAGSFVMAWLGVAAAAAPKADDIRDIRPLILITPWWHWLVIAGAAAVALAVLIAGIRAWRRRSERALTAEERAYATLTRAEALARQGRCREWAETVAGAVRDALAARLGLATCPQTTSELAATDWSSWPHGSTVDGAGLAALLSTLDLTRFALGRLEVSALLTATGAAREWVERLFLPAKPEATTPPLSGPSVPTRSAAPDPTGVRP